MLARTLRGCGCVLVFGKIFNYLCGCTEEQRAFDVSHGAAEVEANEYVWVVWGWRYDGGKLGDVFNVDPDAHIVVGEVCFAHENWAKAWVGVDDAM